MKAPFAYYGGKMGMADWIVSLMPPHRVYMEPFFGSGAVFFAKEQVRHEVVNDLDGNVVAFFRVLRDRPDDLERALRLTPYARDEFMAADLSEDGIDDLERARRFWVRVSQSFGHNGRTGWSVTTARSQSAAASVASRLERLQECAKRMIGVQIEHYDAARLVERLATADTLVYADPPYLGATRRSGRGRGPGASDYLTDMTGEGAHRRLAEALRSTPAAVILSGYPSPLYDELYGDWWQADRATLTHSSRATGSTRGSRTERVWSNRPFPATVAP